MTNDKPLCTICSRFGFEVPGKDNHHILHTPIEITVPLCDSCHRWAEGNPLKFNPTKKRLVQLYPKNKNNICLVALAFHETYASIVEEEIYKHLGKQGAKIVMRGRIH